MRLDDRERPSCVKEVVVSSSSPFMRTYGKFWLYLREMIDVSSGFGVEQN